MGKNTSTGKTIPSYVLCTSLGFLLLTKKDLPYGLQFPLWAVNGVVSPIEVLISDPITY